MASEAPSDRVDTISRNDTLSKKSSSAKMSQARNFLADRKIPDLFNFLLGHLLVDEPDDPIDYLHDLLDKCILFGSGLVEPPLLFDQRHIESLFRSLDPNTSGHISLDAYKIGMNTLGICSFNAEPPESRPGHVDRETFVDEAKHCLVKNLQEMTKKSDCPEDRIPM